MASKTKLMKGLRQIAEEVDQALSDNIRNASVYTYDFRRGHYSGQRDALKNVRDLLQSYFPELYKN